jgi:hypothetical protein
MEEEQLTAGLSTLADELPDPLVDIDAVIQAARVRSRRRAVAAASGGTVVLIAALTLLITTTTRAWTDQPADPVPTVRAVVDDRARTLTAQLTARRDLIPSSLHIEPDDTAATRAIAGAPPPPLEFVKLSTEESKYSAFAKLTDNSGFGTLRIDVDKPFRINPWAKCGSLTGCPANTTSMVDWQLTDDIGRSRRIMGIRTDGIVVTATITIWLDPHLPGPTRPQMPLSNDQLYAFIDVFNY